VGQLRNLKFSLHCKHSSNPTQTSLPNKAGKFQECWCFWRQKQHSCDGQVHLKEMHSVGRVRKKADRVDQETEQGQARIAYSLKSGQ
jgi:hypothetical protein